MRITFHHTPNNTVQISWNGLEYQDTVENFQLDYAGEYPELPGGIVEYQYIDGGRASFFTDDNRQIGATRNMDAIVKEILNDLEAIVENQQARLSDDDGEDEEPIVIDPDKPLDLDLFAKGGPLTKALAQKVNRLEQEVEALKTSKQ